MEKTLTQPQDFLRVSNRALGGLRCGMDPGVEVDAGMGRAGTRAVPLTEWEWEEDDVHRQVSDSPFGKRAYVLYPVGSS